MVYKPQRMRFGTFMAPFHKDVVNPTLAIERDLDLVKLLDDLDFDEAWMGEHHSGAYECIASPELFLATAAERTKHIKLATGVSSVSYHHPLVLADRICQLDHQTRGRVIFGMGPGQLIADAYMMGVDPSSLRDRLEQGLEAITRLMAGDVVTMKTDWFELNEARVHLRPYQAPTMEMAVASAISPTGARMCGQFGLSMLSVAASSPKGFEVLADHWQIAEERAEEFGQTVNRDGWRIVTPFHIAETKEQAEADLRHGLMDMMHYFKRFGGSAFPQAKSFDEALEIWTTGGLGAFGVGVVGTPDDMVEHIEKLQHQSGGFGCFLGLAHNAASWPATQRSWELFARYVMPKFQHSNTNRIESLNWAAQNADRFMEHYIGGIQAATEKHQQEQQAKAEKEPAAAH